MTGSNRRRFLTLSAATLAMPALPRIASAAEPWPKDKTIRAIVPFTAGSTIDILGRIVMDPLSRQLGQTIVIENRGGAGGSIGSAMVAKGDADGYTLLINAAAHSGAPAAYPNLSYDAAKDFACVACFGNVPNVLLMAPSKGIKDIKQFVAEAKKGNMTFGSAGVGSATHWAAERFTEVMTGRVDFIFIGISSGLPFVQDGKLVPLAVSSSKRSPSLKDVPTTVEAGYQNSDYIYWTGLLVPAKTPRPIVTRLHAEITKALALPDVQAKLAQQGVEPNPLSPAEMDAMNKREIDLNLKIAKEAGLKFN